MPKILYLITKSNWGGAQKYVYDLATEAQKRGFEVAVMAGGKGELLQRLKQDNNIRVISLPHLERDINLPAELKSFLNLVKLLRSEKPNILHLNSSKAGGLGALAGRLAGIPKIIFTAHNWAFNEPRPLPTKVLIWLSHWVTIILCHQVVTVSEKNKSQMSYLPFVSHKLVTIYNGLPPLTFLPKKEAREQLSPEDAATLWIGTIAELHRNKGLDILVRAFKNLIRNLPGTCLLIIGEGEERERLARLITAYKLSDSVRLLGHQAEASQYLTAFDVFTLPSRTEALPYVVLEAGAASLPVVASRVGGIPEIITDNESGLLVTPGNYKDLSLALEKMLTAKKLAQTYGKNLKKKVLEKFSKEEMLNQTFALYQR